MNTFKVDDCEIVSSPCKDRVKMQEAVALVINNNKDYNNGRIEVRKLIEAVCDPQKNIVPSPYNPFVFSAMKAFEEHKRLVLSPDIIWLAIIQQLAIHVSENSESLRKKFVNFDEKKSLLVIRDNFIKGEDNDWANVFPDFTSQIKNFIGETNYNNIIGNFSTTDATSKVAFEIAMMDVVKSYFDFGVCTMCGIPEITLEGSSEDWADILVKFNKFEDYNIDWWITDLAPVLYQFIKASQGQVDLEFWKSFFKFRGMSGGPYISGHICSFFPYINGNFNRVGESYLGSSSGFIRSEKVGANSKSLLTTDKFPNGLSSVPFIWKYYEEIYPMSFISGFIGMETTNDSVKPNIGWSVMNRITDEKSFKEEVNRFSCNLDDKSMAKAFSSSNPILM
jgi:hypothetical protein